MNLQIYRVITVTLLFKKSMSKLASINVERERERGRDRDRERQRQTDRVKQLIYINICVYIYILYMQALRERCYKNVSLIYTYKKNTKQKRNRTRNIIWFDPPFNKNVSTNVAKPFLKLLDQHFPKSNKLHTIFNRNTVKVSYSCMENMSSMIKSHNKVINKYVKESKSCNCRVKSECPQNGQCQVTGITYKCTALSLDKPNKVYLGTAEGDLKSDFINIGSRSTMKVAQTIPPFQNIYGNYKKHQIQAQL